MLRMFTAVALVAVAVPLAGQEPQGRLVPPEVRFQRVSNEGLLVFEVTNPNGVPLPFLGYVVDKDGGSVHNGRIAPMHSTVLRYADAWKQFGEFGCATGRGPVKIPGGQTVQFQVYPPPGDWEEMKAGLQWYPSGVHHVGAASVAWSNRVHHQVVPPKKEP